MSFGVQPDGSFVKPSATELFDTLTDDFKSIFGDDIDTSPVTPEGQIIGALSERDAKLYETGEAGYYSKFHQYCLEAQLDDAAAGVGETRLLGRKTQVLGVTLTNNTASPYTVPVGTLFRQSATLREFESLSEVIIPANGSVEVDLQCTIEGAYSASTGSINTIVNPVNGLSSVNNSISAVVKEGRFKESNAEFRRRLAIAKIKSKGGVVSAIAARVREEVSGVTYTSWRENRKNYTDSNGLPSGTFEIIVAGGTDQDIAEKINEGNPAGTDSHGTESQVVIDSEGNEFTIKFSRITDTLIYLVVNLTVNSKYPVDGDLIIKDLLSNITFEQAETVINWSLDAPLKVVPGILDLDILQGTSPSPTLSDNIAIANNSKAKINPENITINKTVV